MRELEEMEGSYNTGNSRRESIFDINSDRRGTIEIDFNNENSEVQEKLVEMQREYYA